MSEKCHGGKEVVTDDDDEQIQLGEDDHTDDEEEKEESGGGVNDEETNVDVDVDEDEDEDEEQELKTTTKSNKRKFIDGNGEHESSDLKKDDGILSNEDFKRIKELKAKKDTKLRLLRKGSAFKIPSSDQLSAKRVDPSQLEVHIRKKMNKEERLAFVRAGREDRVKYQSSTAWKQKKLEKGGGSGGLSNRQKEHKKLMPRAAKRAKISRSQQEKKVKKQRSGKQFRGKKAWK